MIDSVVVLAIGNPAHRSQLIQARPRAMLPALGKPLVARVMNRLHQAGIRNYYVVVGMNEGAVAAYLNAHWVPNAQIQFIFKSHTDSISSILSDAARQLGRPFLLASYNSFTHPQFFSSLLMQHNEHREKLILSGARSTLSSSEEHHFAVVDDAAITEITRTRPAGAASYILTDLAVCGQHFCEYLIRLPDEQPGRHLHFMQIVRQYIPTDGAQAMLAETAWVLQVETDRDLLTLNRQLLDDSQDAHILSELPSSVRIIPPVRIDPQVSVGQNAVIGPYTYLERKSSVGPSARVSQSLILQGASIPRDSVVHETIMGADGPLAG